MGVKLSEMMRQLPKARRDRIAARAEQIREEVEGLQALRKATTKTQVEIAKSLGISQPSVAKIERQADMYLSTLRSYVEAAGGRLSLIVQFKDGQTVRLNGLADIPSANDRGQKPSGKSARTRLAHRDSPPKTKRPRRSGAVS